MDILPFRYIYFRDVFPASVVRVKRYCLHILCLRHTELGVIQKNKTEYHCCFPEETRKIFFFFFFLSYTQAHLGVAFTHTATHTLQTSMPLSAAIGLKLGWCSLHTGTRTLAADCCRWLCKWMKGNFCSTLLNIDKSVESITAVISCWLPDSLSAEVNFFGLRMYQWNVCLQTFIETFQP